MIERKKINDLKKENKRLKGKKQKKERKERKKSMLSLDQKA